MKIMDMHDYPRRPRVRIPYLNRQEDHEPIRDCVLRAAERTNLPPVQVALVMAHFFEAVMDQVLRNGIVRIPGFGKIGPKTRFRKVPSRYSGDLPCAYPAFVPSAMFKHAVKLQVPPAASKETDPMRKGCNSYRPGVVRNPPHVFFPKFRKDIAAANQPSRLRRHAIL